jgi:gamma-glutamyltranspeptidase/glutathione hydrolase
MSPLIVSNKESIYALGSPGADRISTALAQVINNYITTNDWTAAILKPRFHVNQDQSVRAEPESIEDNKNVTFTNSNDMYFGGVCVTGINDDVVAYGDKRRGDISWTN